MCVTECPVEGALVLLFVELHGFAFFVSHYHHVVTFKLNGNRTIEIIDIEILAKLLL